jgi:hypothetical protein
MGRRRSHTTPRKSKSKAGDAYQAAVAQVARSIDPTATISVGVWVNGPDGRRDLDVLVRSADASAPTAVIECKDWSRPIGIGLIDALESKRRDLGANVVAMICSNSGFTSDALKKAARVGIPALAALIRDDDRIRVVVRQQIYTRVIDYIYHSPLFHHPQLSDEAKLALGDQAYTADWTYQGKSLEAWVSTRLTEIATSAVDSREFVATYCFSPLSFAYRKVPVEVTRIDIRGTFKVQWMTQVAQIGASQGMYDYFRKVVIFGPGPYQFNVTINSETWGQPVALLDVPPGLLVPIDQRIRPGEMDFVMIKNLPQSDPKDAPDLAPFIASAEVVDVESEDAAMFA